MAKPAQISQIQASILEHGDLIRTGRILCVDPSAGSGSSLPGYAIYEAGKLVESGLIKLEVGSTLHLRLGELGRTLREDFEAPDLLVVEYIGGYAFGPLRYNINAYHSLIKAAGVTVSSVTCPVIEVPPSVWKQYIDSDYVKGDEADAVYIGRYVIRSAYGILGEPTNVRPKKPRKVRTKTTKKKKSTKSRRAKKTRQARP